MTTILARPLDPPTGALPSGLKRAWRERRRSILHGLWSRMPSRWAVAHQYRRKNGVWPDLRNPRDFSEKICWLKLNEHTPLHTLCADKLRVREHVAELIGAEHLVPLYLVTRDVSDLRPDRIAADRFVVKANHDQGSTRRVPDKAAADFTELRRDLARRLAANQFDCYKEPQYRDIPPTILVEKDIAPEGGDLPDYKLFCFGGRVGLIQVDWDRRAQHRQAFFTTDWKQLPCHAGYPFALSGAGRPSTLDRMIEIAEILSRPFRFVRIDLYEADGRVYFGEITFHPGAGRVRFKPDAYERRFGEMIDLGGRVAAPAPQKSQAMPLIS